MSSIVLSPGATGAAAFTIEAPSTATSRVITLPDATDTLVGKATTDTLTNKTLVAPALGTPASGDLTNCTNKVILGTEQATTSGTSIDFTGIPSGVKRITVMYAGITMNASANLLIQIGDSGGIEITGYASAAGDYVPTANHTSSTAGFVCSGSTTYGSNAARGVIVLNLEDASDFSWVAQCSGSGSQPNTFAGTGNKSLSAVLDRVRITTVAGTSTFTAGSINILYES